MIRDDLLRIEGSRFNLKLSSCSEPFEFILMPFFKLFASKHIFRQIEKWLTFDFLWSDVGAMNLWRSSLRKLLFQKIEFLQINYSNSNEFFSDFADSQIILTNSGLLQIDRNPDYPESGFRIIYSHNYEKLPLRLSIWELSISKMFCYSQKEI